MVVVCADGRVSRKRRGRPRICPLTQSRQLAVGTCLFPNPPSRNNGMVVGLNHEIRTQFQPRMKVPTCTRDMSNERVSDKPIPVPPLPRSAIA